MPCIDCLQNCPDIISDQCITYTGPDIPLLNICQGNQLPVYEANVANALITALNGTGILPSAASFETCPFLAEQVGTQVANLNNLLQIIGNNDCTFNTQINAINATIAAMQSTVFDTGCLTLLADPTRDQILQALVTLTCSLNATVALFPSTYVQLTDLTTLVTPIVNNIITGASGGGTPQQYTKMVPSVAYEYYGSMSNFDATGKGLLTAGFDKVYVCNGANGTPDKRGRVAVGAIKGVPGGTGLDPAVDPSVNPLNPNWGLLDKAGETYHLLITAESPTHTHTITDPGHTHIQTIFRAVNQGGVIPVGYSQVNGEVSGPYSTKSSATGITINSTGGSQPHNNIQPSIAANFIMYLP